MTTDHVEHTCLEEATLDARLFKFLDDMMPTKLFWRGGVYDKDLRVFWSQKASTSSAIRERIITSLCFCPSALQNGTLIQFWAAEMIGGQRHLTTTLQPFSLPNYMLSNEKIIMYRKICLGSNLVVLGDEHSMDGILGRVFRNQLPEGSPDLSYYSVTEYPQLELALSCGFNSTLALPVLQPPEQRCIGVLELLSTKNVLSDFNIYEFSFLVNKMLMEAHLETVDMAEICGLIENASVEKEIKAALDNVSKIHKLPLAFGWVRCTHIGCVDDRFSHKSCNDVVVCWQGELLVLNPTMSFPSLKDLPFSCHDALLNVALNERQGLVGKAALSCQPYFCRDVCQLSITEYPFVHFARKLGVTCCLAVCLQNISTGNHEYVVEFFLPRDKTYIGNLHNFLSSILTTMKQHLRTFEIVTHDLGNKLFVEVDKFSFHKELESFKEFPTVNAQLEFEALQNGGEDLQSDHLIDHQLVIEDIDVLEQPDIAIKIPLVKQSKAQNLEQKCPYSREDLEQHFGKKLTDAAGILGVSRSTVKRWCREHNIRRWPSSKRSKVCSSSSTLKQTNVVSQGNVETISQAVGRCPSCSEPATDVALMPAMSTITIKVAYGNVVIMFKLSYSSTMAELVENVIKRTRLAEGTFNITYLDEENDPILLACDEDLQNCMDSFRISGKTAIRMKINKSP